MTRYAKQPRRSERLVAGPDESWEIVAVHDHGRVIEVIDLIGRLWRKERAEAGWWLVVRADA